MKKWISVAKLITARGFSDGCFERVVTARGSPNIALIKYWGKRDEKLVLPYHSSISLTLDGDTELIYGEKELKLYTITSVMISDRLHEDVIYINGKHIVSNDTDVYERIRVIDIMRSISGMQQKVLVVSENAFPTSTGLASSASGIATLVVALSKAMCMEYSHEQLSMISRMGSGSASRSIFGGIVRWDKGVQPDGYDSFARQLFPVSHWPELVDMIVIVSEERKRISSRAGMASTVRSSSLYKERLRIVEDHLEELEIALRDKNFPMLASVIMKDSNNMHATMLDSRPPLMYLDNGSRAIIEAIENINEKSGQIIAGYSFDAGTNAHVITLQGYVGILKDALSEIRGVRSIIVARVGTGPKFLKDNESLIDQEHLIPRQSGDSSLEA